MNTTAINISELLTGKEEIDLLIRNAYDLGMRHGKVLDRESLRRNVQVDTTKRLLKSLMCTQGIDLQTALIKLRIPKAERKTYVKIFVSKQNKKITKDLIL